MELDIEVNEHNVAMITVVPSSDGFRFIGRTSIDAWQTTDRLTVLGIKATDKQKVIGGDRSILEKYVEPDSLCPGRFATDNCVGDVDGLSVEEFFELPTQVCEEMESALNLHDK